MPATPAIIPRTQPLLGPTGVGSNNQVLSSDGAGGTHWVTASSGGVTDHGALTGLGDDDHSQYPLSAGRAGGQTIVGGVNGSDKLVLSANSAFNVSIEVSNEGLSVGGAAISGVRQTIIQVPFREKGIVIAGKGRHSSSPTDNANGVVILCEWNTTNNRQLLIGDSAKVGLSTGIFARLISSSSGVVLDAVTGTGQRSDMIFGTDTSNVTFGHNVNGPSNAKAFFGGEATKATAVFRTATSQTANAIEVQSPAGARLSGVGPNGAILNAVFSDATRPAAGIAGRVIFNSDDGNLNIDTGTQWVTPDGTIT